MLVDDTPYAGPVLLDVGVADEQRFAVTAARHGECPESRAFVDLAVTGVVPVGDGLVPLGDDRSGEPTRNPTCVNSGPCHRQKREPGEQRGNGLSAELTAAYRQFHQAISGICAGKSDGHLTERHGELGAMSEHDERERKHRPVPEIKRVADPSDECHRSARQKPSVHRRMRPERR